VENGGAVEFMQEMHVKVLRDGVKGYNPTMTALKVPISNSSFFGFDRSFMSCHGAEI
jgi:hypothetical protein